MDSEKKRDFVDKFFNSNIFDGESGEIKKKYYENLINDLNKNNEIKSLFRYRSFANGNCEKKDFTEHYNYEDLKYNKMVFSPISFFNDPFDCDYLIKITSNDIEEKDKLSLKLKIQDIINKINSTYRIACLCEDNDSILMWSHYADNHKGICVEYDFERLIDTFKPDLFPIIYTENRTIYTQDDICCYSLTFQRHVFFKSDIWSYEKEWRILKPKKNEEEIFKKIILMPKAIYIGYKMPEENKKKLITLCENNNLECWQMQLDENEYKLSPKRIL